MNGESVVRQSGHISALCKITCRNRRLFNYHNSLDGVYVRITTNDCVESTVSFDCRTEVSDFLLFEYLIGNFEVETVCRHVHRESFFQGDSVGGSEGDLAAFRQRPTDEFIALFYRSADRRTRFRQAISTCFGKFFVFCIVDREAGTSPRQLTFIVAHSLKKQSDDIDTSQLYGKYLDFFCFFCYNIVYMSNIQFFVKNIKHNAIEKPPFHLIRTSGTNDFLLLLFKSIGEMTVNKQKQPYQVNSFILLKPHTPHSINTLDKILVHDYIHFNVNDKEKLLAFNDMFNKLFICEHAEDISNLIHLAHKEYLFQKTYTDSRTIINQLMSLILSLSVRTSYQVQSLTHNEQKLKAHFEEFRAAVYNDHLFPTSIKEAAASVFLSESRFSHLYKKFFNVSPKKDILLAQIQYAKELLLTTDLSVRNIAEKCLFSNEYVFIRSFKSQVGVSPGKWR